MLVLLPTISSFWVGLGYILLFGVGTIVSMGIITVLLGIPFSISSSFDRVNGMIAGVAGVASLIFGVGLMSDIAFGTAIIPF